MDLTEDSETSAKHNLTPGKYPKEHIQTCDVNPLTPNGHYSGRTAPLTSRHCILNIYSTNIRIEYFKRAA
jgi:hypothetical protein